MPITSRPLQGVSHPPGTVAIMPGNLGTEGETILASSLKTETEYMINLM